MAIIRWDPLAMMRWPSSIFDEEEMSLAATGGDSLDVYETNDSVVVRANVAGISEEKVEITFEKGVLWIRAQEEEEKKEGRKYYRKASRSYSYKVAVPGNIDLKKEPDAEIKEGVVMVTFAKAEEEKPKKIMIRKK